MNLTCFGIVFFIAFSEQDLAEVALGARRTITSKTLAGDGVRPTIRMLAADLVPAAVVRRLLCLLFSCLTISFFRLG